MDHAVGMIEMGSGGSSFIYRIDDNPGLGAVVPNRGSGGYDLTVQAEPPPTGFPHYLSAVYGNHSTDGIPSAAFGGWDDPWTILCRVGDFPQITLAGGGFNTLFSYASILQREIGQSLQSLRYSHENAPDWSRFFTGVVRRFELDQPTPAIVPPNTTYLITYMPSGTWKIVATADGGDSFTTIDTSPGALVGAGPGVLYQTARINPVLFRTATQTTGVLYDWSQSFNGLAWWRVYCNTDDDFRSLYNEFITA